jgi:hypothetical protein
MTTLYIFFNFSQLSENSQPYYYPIKLTYILRSDNREIKKLNINIDISC